MPYQVSTGQSTSPVAARPPATSTGVLVIQLLLVISFLRLEALFRVRVRSFQSQASDDKNPNGNWCDLRRYQTAADRQITELLLQFSRYNTLGGALG